MKIIITLITICLSITAYGQTTFKYTSNYTTLEFQTSEIIKRTKNWLGENTDKIDNATKSVYLKIRHGELVTLQTSDPFIGYVLEVESTERKRRRIDEHETKVVTIYKCKDEDDMVIAIWYMSGLNWQVMIGKKDDSKSAFFVIKQVI